MPSGVNSSSVFQWLLPRFAFVSPSAFVSSFHPPLSLRLLRFDVKLHHYSLSHLVKQFPPHVLQLLTSKQPRSSSRRKD